MKVRDVMERQVRTCRIDETLADAGRIMAEAGCGVLPVVHGPKVVGMISDRDVCLELATRDERPSTISVREVMRKDVHACTPEGEIGEALRQMSLWKVRRLPVVEVSDARLVGIVSLDEIVLHARAVIGEDFSGPLLNEVAETLRAICRHEVPAV